MTKSKVQNAENRKSVLPRQHRQILCVDDNVELLQILKERFEKAGYDVDISPNGFQAVARLNRNPSKYQVVVTDIRMPGLDGFGLIEQARVGGYGGPFVVFAAALSPDQRQRLNELGVRRIIDKPGLAGELLNSVQEAQQGF